MEDKTASFGFSDVPAQEKAPLVQGVFSSVAQKYDIMNDLMSFGTHRLWKDYFIKKVNPKPHKKLLDVAGGTGDIAFRFLKKGGQQATILDLTQEMLDEGRARADNAGIISNIDFIQGSAEQLPFEDHSFDCCTIAFGLRNVTYIDKALREMRRVLKPNGQFFCLEFSKVVLPFLPTIYDFYSFNIYPQIGQMVAGDKESYQYLAESIRRFPPQDDLLQMMQEAGFKHTKYENIFGGIVAIHQGYSYG